MTCQYCGKPVGLLRRLKGNRYCSAAHEREEELNPAALVLKTLFQTLPEEPEVTRSPEPPPPRGAQSTASTGDRSHDVRPPTDLLAELLEPAAADKHEAPIRDHDSPKTAPDPQPVGFLLQLPEPCQFGSARRLRRELPVLSAELAWLDGSYGVELGEASVDWLPDQNLQESSPKVTSLRRLVQDSYENLPLASFLGGFSGLLGTYAPVCSIEWLRPRSGPRPALSQLMTPCELSAKLSVPARLASPAEPVSGTASPATSDLQNTLVQMLVGLTD